MHFTDTLSNVEVAKEAFFEAENENQDWKRKLDLYVSASKNYLLAANLVVGNRSVVDALVFLSSSALFKADLANTMLRTASLVSGNEQEHMTAASGVATLSHNSGSRANIGLETEPIGHASLSGRVLLSANISAEMKNNVGSSSKMRLSGLMGVPKAGNVAPSDAAYDLFFLEKKLAELGLMTGSSGSSYKSNGNTLTSALGESFMLLSTNSSRTKGSRAPFPSKNAVAIPFSSRDALGVKNLEQPRASLSSHELCTRNMNAPLFSVPPSSIGIPTLSQAPISGPYGGLKIKGPGTPVAQSSQNIAGSKSIGTFWLPNPIDILTWRGIKSSSPVPYIEAPSQEKPVKEFAMEESCQFDLNWNDDQSVYGAAPSSLVHKGHSERKNDSDSQIISASAIQGYFISPHATNTELEIAEKSKDSDQGNNNNHFCDNSNSNSNSNLNNSTIRESELRLLQSIKRLGDENYSLLQRIDLLSEVEARNLDLHKEMSSFKKEYQDRFSRLKEVLREFQRKNNTDGNSRTFGFEFNTVIGTHPGDTYESKISREEKKNTKDDSKSGAMSRDDSTVTLNDPENLRQQQLERTVLALVKRLEEGKMELDKRDRLISKYEKYYRQLKRDAERRETERKGAGPGSEYDKFSHPVPPAFSSPSSSSTAQVAVKSSSTTNAGTSRSVNTALNSLSASSNASQSALRQPPRPPSLVARNKHPSISTLETTLGLQRDRAGGQGVRYSHGGVQK